MAGFRASAVACCPCTRSACSAAKDAAWGRQGKGTALHRLLALLGGPGGPGDLAGSAILTSPYVRAFEGVGHTRRPQAAEKSDLNPVVETVETVDIMQWYAVRGQSLIQLTLWRGMVRAANPEYHTIKSLSLWHTVYTLIHYNIKFEIIIMLNGALAVCSCALF